jgi:hypothetical protein
VDNAPNLERAMSSRFVAVTLLFSSYIFADTAPAAQAPNTNPVYQQLRYLTLSGEAFAVSEFELKRDVGTFHFSSGTVCFVMPVDGKVTGAVFVGDGNFVLHPESESERRSLKLLSKEDDFSEKFDHAVLRFTDSTYDEIKKAAKPASTGCNPGLLKDSQNTTRHILKHNLEARLLEGVLSPEPDQFFYAFIHGKKYNDREIFEIEPKWSVSQVNFRTYDDNKAGNWLSSSLMETHNIGRRIQIEHQTLDVTFERNGKLSGKATSDLVAHKNGVQVVPFDLFRPLRVQRVTANGQPLFFIQEDKNEDGNFVVILPQALAKGEKISVTSEYEGKDAVSNEGGGNYFPIAREDWFPNQPGAEFGDFTPYDMTFRIPKGMKMVATGTLVSETNDAGHNVTVWKSENPQTVAGFSFGRFKVEQAKLTKPDYDIQSYANEDSPDWVQALKRSGAPVGSMETTGLNKKALAEAELATELYSDYFGPTLFKHLQITQQTACNFGQSWPELVWIPICYYFDTTVRHELGLDWGDRGYWKVVTPHEVAHQWWGNTVGFASGRDQWMSEGFAETSASLYISMIEKNPKKFIEFWNDERDLLLERNAQGYRAIDAGPLTMGYRASNSRTGFDTTRRLIYPKGAYILHMIRMMMWNRKTGDENFKAAMHDFVETYSGKAASTEEFKAMMEKHMTSEMDLDGNHRLDWFFNEYVYGTALPTYKSSFSFDKNTDGDIVLGIKITQSGVDDKFKMSVPIYLELADGRTVPIGRARVTGNTTLEQKVPLKGLKDTPKRALLNYNDDVLASKD